MESHFIIVARQLAVGVSASEVIGQGKQTGELQPIRAANGEDVYFVNSRESAHQYKDWMVQHFGNEANYEVVEVKVSI